jgi:hypothetical protein
MCILADLEKIVRHAMLFQSEKSTVDRSLACSAPWDVFSDYVWESIFEEVGYESAIPQTCKRWNTIFQNVILNVGKSIAKNIEPAAWRVVSPNALPKIGISASDEQYKNLCIEAVRIVRHMWKIGFIKNLLPNPEDVNKSFLFQNRAQICIQLSSSTLLARIHSTSTASFFRVDERKKISVVFLPRNVDCVLDFRRAISFGFSSRRCLSGGLMTLEMERYGTTIFPTDLRLLMPLESLSLSGNKIQTLPDTIGFLQNLRVLDLSLNLLKKLPEGFGKLVLLRSLNLEGNMVKTLPTFLEKLISLRWLNLRSNNLIDLPDGLINLPILRCLDISNNPGLRESRKVKAIIAQLRRQGCKVIVS